MKGKNFIVLCVVALILIGLAYFLTTQNRLATAPSSLLGKPLLTAIQDTEVLNNAKNLTFVSADGTVAVARVNEVWVAPSRFGHPVEYNKVHEMVTKLRGLKIDECLPSGRQQMEELKLLSPKEVAATNASAGTLVELRDKDDKVLSSVVFGKEHRRAEPDGREGYGGGGFSDGRYAALGDKTYLVSGTVDGIPRSVKDWLDADLANVASADLSEIEIKDPAGKTLALKKPESGGDLTVGDLGPKEEMESSKVSSLSGVLNYLRLSDVADPKLTDEQMGFDKATVVVAKAKNRKLYTIKIGGVMAGPDDRYVRMNVELLPGEDTESTAKAEDKKAEKKADDKKPADEAKKKVEEAKKKEEREKLEKEVRDQNAKFQKWTYMVAKYKVDAVSVERKDFVKAKEEKKDEKKEAKNEGEKGEKKGFFKRLFGGKDDKPATEEKKDDKSKSAGDEKKDDKEKDGSEKK